MKRITPLESSREISLVRKISSNSETVGIYTFFEASRFGCRKTIFDATKVTYNMYSCAIIGMSREIMKMDRRDSAECQNWEKKDIDDIIEIVKLDNKTKLCIVSSSSNGKSQEKTWGRRNEMQKVLFLFLERESVPSL